MRKYYNAGGAGRSYSKMEVWSAAAPYPSTGFNVGFAILDSYGTECDTHLSPEQVRDLHGKLGAWLSKNASPPPPLPPPSMIEGDEI